MKSISIQKLAFLLPILLFTIKISAQSAHKNRVEGDQFFSKKEMDKAEEAYRRSLELEPNHAGGQYNLGNSLYFQGRYPQAAEAFEKAAARSRTVDERADAFHNLGNSNFKSGKYQAAAEAFKNSLKNRPGDSETVRNLRLAQKKIEEEKKKEKEQQQSKDQNQDKNQPDNQKNQDQQKQNQQQKDQNQSQNGDPKQQQPQQKKEQNQQPNQMTKEQAKRLLETAIEQEDRKNGKKYRQQRPDPRAKTDKDW